jgi:hypothetical protein
MIASEKPMAHGPRVGAIVRLPRDSTWGDICQ